MAYPAVSSPDIQFWTKDQDFVSVEALSTTHSAARIGAQGGMVTVSVISRIAVATASVGPQSCTVAQGGAPSRAEKAFTIRSSNVAAGPAKANDVTTVHNQIIFEPLYHTPV
jgi:hypothetical protein